MGQKVHPGGLRVGVIHDWKSNWFAGKKDFAEYILEDVKIREHIQRKLSHAGLSDILIRKDKQRVTIDIYTARPGIVIGKSGVEVDALRKELHALTKKNVHININEIKRPELDAKLVAQSIAEQLENRVSFRRAMKRSLASAIRSGAQGIKIQCGGRLGGWEMSPLGELLRGPRPAAHDPRRHRLRLRRGEDDLRPDRRQGLDQQGRDHAGGLRPRERARGAGARRPGSGAAAPRRPDGGPRRLPRVRPRPARAGPRGPRPRAPASSRPRRPRPSRRRPRRPRCGRARPGGRGPGGRGAAGAQRDRRQDNVERPKTDEQARSAEGREQPVIEPEVEVTPDVGRRRAGHDDAGADDAETTSPESADGLEPSDSGERGVVADAAAEEDEVPQGAPRPHARRLAGPDRRCSTATTGSRRSSAAGSPTARSRLPGSR